VVIPNDDLLVGDPLYAECVGTANPPVEKYSWSIGNREFSEKSEKIRIDKVTKEQNGELLKCEAKNAIGTTTAEIKLDIKCKCV